MRIFRLFLVGLCLAPLTGCWYHRPFFAYRCGGCCPASCAPAPHCACYLGTPEPMHSEPPLFVAPQPVR